jgi:hypothetical protein
VLFPLEPVANSAKDEERRVLIAPGMQTQSLMGQSVVDKLFEVDVVVDGR